MKKIILISLLLLSSLIAKEQEAKIYTGLSVGYLNESFSGNIGAAQTDKSNSGETAKFKLGYGIREAYAVEFSIDYRKSKTNVFSTAPQEDGDKFGLNVELIKAFDWDIFVLPYFKAGFGAGNFKIDNENDPGNNSLNYSSFNLGLGMLIPVNEHLDFEIGYDYRYVSYEKFEVYLSDVQSHMNGTYVGVNVRF